MNEPHVPFAWKFASGVWLVFFVDDNSDQLLFHHVCFQQQETTQNS